MTADPTRITTAIGALALAASTAQSRSSRTEAMIQAMKRIVEAGQPLGYQTLAAEGFTDAEIRLHEHRAIAGFKQRFPALAEQAAV
jgi:hypothetical protein